jgi:hypothetical protein
VIAHLSIFYVSCNNFCFKLSKLSGLLKLKMFLHFLNFFTFFHKNGQSSLKIDDFYKSGLRNGFNSVRRRWLLKNIINEIYRRKYTISHLKSSELSINNIRHEVEKTEFLRSREPFDIVKLKLKLYSWTTFSAKTFYAKLKNNVRFNFSYYFIPFASKISS